MKTELEKCLSGEWYDCHAPVFMGFKRKTHELLLKYNSLPYDYKEEKYALLKEMFESVGKKVSVGHSFICDYGCNISIGNNVSINTRPPHESEGLADIQSRNAVRFHAVKLPVEL